MRTTTRRPWQLMIPSQYYCYHHHSYHNFALTRQIPNSFLNSISKYYDAADDDDDDDDGRISIKKAKSQHDDYVALLRSRVPTIELPPLEEHPDSVFVEDTVVAIENRAVITHPGHVSRRGEVASIRSTLQQMGMDIWDMNSINPGAICDGGDVLFTGRHMFVGLTDRTNDDGVEVLRDAFSNQKFPVISVPLNTDDALHLKSIITHMDSTTLLAPIGPIGDAVLREMKIMNVEEEEDLGYKILRLPDIHACNVVALNDLIVASTSCCQQSKELLQKAANERNLQLEFVESTEIAKSDGASTCCSVLLRL